MEASEHINDLSKIAGHFSVGEMRGPEFVQLWYIRMSEYFNLMITRAG